MAPPRGEVLQGKLDLIVLANASRHGHGMAMASPSVFSRVSEDLLKLIRHAYPALLRFEQRGWISSEMGSSETQPQAKFYSLTRAGPQTAGLLKRELERMTALMARFLGGTKEHEMEWLRIFGLRFAWPIPQAELGPVNSMRAFAPIST